MLRLHFRRKKPVAEVVEPTATPKPDSDFVRLILLIPSHNYQESDLEKLGRMVVDGDYTLADLQTLRGRRLTEYALANAMTVAKNFYIGKQRERAYKLKLAAEQKMLDAEEARKIADPERERIFKEVADGRNYKRRTQK